jgi:carbon monoxide dehydrogenase subunit G
MAIEIEERFQVSAPIDRVWAFVMDPQRVAACMPGAKLEQVIDERTFLGSIRVKVGAITAAYKGKVQFTQIDAGAHTVQMTAEGTETGGGTAKGTMSSSLKRLPDGQTELVAKASVDLTGRVMQVGRGMIQGVSHQLFKQFVASAKRQLETPVAAGTGAGAAAGATASAPLPAVPHEGEAIRVIPLLFRTLVAAIVGFFQRLFRKPEPGE